MSESKQKEDAIRKRLEGPCCFNCPMFELTNAPQESDLGSGPCRRMPPKVLCFTAPAANSPVQLPGGTMRIETKIVTVWPTTKTIDWCAQHPLINKTLGKSEEVKSHED